MNIVFLLVSGIFNVGQVDSVTNGFASIEYRDLKNDIAYIDVSLQDAACKVSEGDTVIFNSQKIVDCL